MAISQGRSFTRANSLYERSVTPRRSQQIRGLLNRSTAETAALLATTILCEFLNRWNNAGPDEVALAQAAVRQALAADPTLYLAHYAQGFLFRIRGRHPDALAAFDRTIQHAPDFARAYAQRGEELLYLGRFQDAIVAAGRAKQISPESSVKGYFDWVIGRAHFFLGQYPEAIDALESSVRTWPNVWYNRTYLIAAHALSGKRSDARRVLRAFDRRFPGYTVARVIENETATPDTNRLVRAGRGRFHQGLSDAGMPA